MNALESRIDPPEGAGKGARDKVFDSDIDSMFRTKIRWDHHAEAHVKTPTMMKRF